jgi:hypothetical protein
LSGVDKEKTAVGRRVTGSTSLPGIADAVVFESQALWIATVNGYALIRIDPRTLRMLLIHIT